MYKVRKQEISRQDGYVLQHTLEGPIGRHDQERQNATDSPLKNEEPHNYDNTQELRQKLENKISWSASPIVIIQPIIFLRVHTRKY